MAGDLKLLVNQLRATLGKMEVALGAIDESIVWTDSGGRIQWSNTTFDRLVNRSRFQVLGACLYDLLPLSWQAQALSREQHPLHLGLAGQNQNLGIYEFWQAERQHFLEVIVNRFDLPQQDLSLVLVIRDVSEAQRLEAERQRAEEERLRAMIAEQMNQALQQEIADRKQAEQALHETKERFRSLVETTHDWVWEVNEQMVYTYASPRVEDILGYTPAEILGKTLFDLMPPEEAQRVADLFGPLAAAHQAFVCLENTNRHRNGSLVVLETSGVPFFGAKGEFCGYRGIDRNITERKRHEAALQQAHQELEGRVQERTAELEQANRALQAEILERKQAEVKLRHREAKFRSLIQNSTDIITLLAADGTIQYESPAVETVLGYQPEDLVGRNVFDWIHPEDSAAIQSIIGALIANPGRTMRTELRFRHRDGSWCDLESIGTNLLQDPAVEAMVVNSRDISERKQTEAVLMRAKAAAEAATQAKSEFLATMSHEIRTPMNAVIGMANLLLQTSLSDQQREFVQTLHSSGELLLALINNILDFSKIESNKLDLEQQPFDLQTCLQDALNLFRAEAAEKGLELVLHLEPGIPNPILGDGLRLRQILLNLLSNAVKFTETGQITVIVTAEPVTATRETNADRSPELFRIQFAVQDTGIGIAPDRMERLFLAFSQVDSSTTRKYGGTGLGLAISKRLVEMMEGRIWVESQAGQGSTFYFTILAAAAGPEARPFLPPASPSTPDSPSLSPEPLSGQPLQILLVEDNVVNQKVAGLLLNSLGYSADLAANGREALAALRRQPYDVVLMDVQMPEMDGLEASRRICREWPPEERPRIIAMTANVLEGDREACLAAGMDDYISKPIAIKALEQALQACPRRWPPPPALDEQVFQSLHDMAGANTEILAELLDCYLDSAPEQLQTLTQALHQRDAALLQRTAHTLKSSSATLGALPLADLCKKLEEIGRLGMLDTAAANIRMAASEYERVRGVLQMKRSFLD